MLARIALAALAFAAACAPTQQTGGVPRLTAADADPIRIRHLDAVNAARAQNGLAPLQLSAELNAAAETHARDMSVQKRAWHFGSDLTSWRERGFRAGYRGEVLGENLYEGADSDLTVLKYWLEVPDTRRVIMAPAGRGLGLGWHQDAGGKLWWVQLVGA
ncbi:CAP domain-containing protein [Amaricoccus sp.]|uniref:CAP domain-containing protein n=1 Tax=Amaricoccus sp. TaxID=1872485 RepID=UPI001B7B837D|nr:CAP domain-containing protein [Amaricoccus sp.]MBP7240431.1 CAP domain-containing protein [Amaricoccus sp.]